MNEQYCSDRLVSQIVSFTYNEHEKLHYLFNRSKYYPKGQSVVQIP